MSTWNPSYRTFNPADPALFKSQYVGANGVDPGYAGAVRNYNQWLYTPMDRRGAIPLSPITQAHYDASRTGWQGGGGVAPGTTQTPYGNVTTSTGGQYAMLHGMMAPRPAFTASASRTDTGAAGPNGDPSPSFSPAQPSAVPSALVTAPSAQYQGAPTPPQNAMQRWQGAGAGLPPMSDARKFFWATGRIDGRAPMANVQSGLDTGASRGYAGVQFRNSGSNWNTGADNGIKFNNSPSGWSPF